MTFEVKPGISVSERIDKEEFRVSVSTNGTNWSSISIPRNPKDIQKLITYLEELKRQATIEAWKKMLICPNCDGKRDVV